MYSLMVFNNFLMSVEKLKIKVFACFSANLVLKLLEPLPIVSRKAF